MSYEPFEVVPIATVVGGRIDPTDDYWGGTRAIVRIDSDRYTSDATLGLEAFSHLEIVFRFHLTDQTDLNLGARSPRVILLLSLPTSDQVDQCTIGHRPAARAVG